MTTTKMRTKKKNWVNNDNLEIQTERPIACKNIGEVPQEYMHISSWAIPFLGYCLQGAI